jgi:hypothetical protein
MPKIQWVPLITVSIILLCPAHYCVEQNNVSTLVFNMHLFKFPVSTCCCHIMLHSTWSLIFVHQMFFFKDIFQSVSVFCKVINNWKPVITAKWCYVKHCIRPFNKVVPGTFTHLKWCLVDLKEYCIRIHEQFSYLNKKDPYQ